MHGAPELVIEVKSPSNTRAQLQELTTLCLTHGSREVWIVDQEHQSVTVVRQSGARTLYEAGSEIPLDAFVPGSLPVDEIFAV
jgi:Uma2 family endonuclease